MLASERVYMLPFERSLRRKTRLVGEKRSFGGLQANMPYRYGRMADARGQRMSISTDVPDVTDDWGLHATASMDAIDPAGVQAKRRSDRWRTEHMQVKAFSKEGVRSGVGICLIAALCFVLGVMTLLNISEMMAEGKTYSAIQTSIDDYTAANQELEESLSTKSKNIDVGYEAAAIGMINAKGVKMISLTVPQDVTLSSGTVTAMVSEHLATTLGD